MSSIDSSPNICTIPTIVREMNLAQREFYDTSSKNSIFKKSQKLECARIVVDRFNFKEIMECTCYRIPGNSIAVFFDYTVFKMFANERNYTAIVQYIMALLDSVIQSYGKYEFHTNIQTFTVSAAERYRPIIDIFSNTCLASNTLYSEVLTKFYTYHTPSIVETIRTMLGPIVPPLIKTKLVFVKKQDSEARLRALLGDLYY
jgi:hypothetical protein